MCSNENEKKNFDTYGQLDLFISAPCKCDLVQDIFWDGTVKFLIALNPQKLIFLLSI